MPGSLGPDARNAEDADKEPLGFAAESEAHQVSDDLPGEIEATGHLDVEAAVAEGAPVFRQWIILQFSRKSPIWRRAAASQPRVSCCTSDGMSSLQDTRTRW